MENEVVTGIKVKDIKKAHAEGCEDVRRVLETLFLEVFQVYKPKLGTYTSKIGLIHVFVDEDGDYRILGPYGLVKWYDEDGSDSVYFNRLSGLEALQSKLIELDAKFV